MLTPRHPLPAGDELSPAAILRSFQVEQPPDPSRAHMPQPGPHEMRLNIPDHHFLAAVSASSRPACGSWRRFSRLMSGSMTTRRSFQALKTRR